MSISYDVIGRFGNNLLQYFATKVIAKYTNKIFVYKTKFSNVIEDHKFKDTYYECIKNPSCLEGNIYMYGYFQKDFWINKEREYLYSLLTEDNEDRFNDNLLIKDLVYAIKNVRNDLLELVTNRDNLIVHVRLDDFIYNGFNTDVINPYFLRDYIKDIISLRKYKKCIFIVDILRQDWEREYMNILLSIPNSMVLTNDMLTDFSLLFYSKNLMVSRSSFSWIASGCSIHNENIWVPTTTKDTHQNFNSLGKNSISFEAIYL